MGRCVIITDATHPEFMIKTGYYDTHPGSGSFSGAWGAILIFPSGTLVVSDISEGFVLHPTYVHTSFRREPSQTAIAVCRYLAQRLLCSR